MIEHGYAIGRLLDERGFFFEQAVRTMSGIDDETPSARAARRRRENAERMRRARAIAADATAVDQAIVAGLAKACSVPTRTNVDVTRIVLRHAVGELRAQGCSWEDARDRVFQRLRTALEPGKSQGQAAPAQTRGGA